MKRLAKYLLAFLFYFFSLFSFAQQNLLTGKAGKIDSLLSLLKKDKEDTNKVIHLNKLSSEYKNIASYDTAMQMGNAALQLAEKLNFKQGVSAALNNIGLVYNKLSDYPKALDYQLRSLKICEEIGNKKGVSSSLINIGNVYGALSDYPKALDYHLRSLKIKEEIGDKQGVSASLNNIGNVYDALSDYPKALDYHLRSLKLREEIGDKQGVASSLNNIGNVYQSLSDYPKALDYHLRSLKIKEEISDKEGVARSLMGIGNVYQSLSDYPKALDYHLQSLKIKEEIGDKQGVALSLGNIGELYLKQKQYILALQYTIQAVQKANKIGDLDTEKDFQNTLYEIYKATGNNLKALKHYERFILLRDSVFNGQKLKELYNSKLSYEMAIKEKQIKLLQNDKVIKNITLQRYFILSISLIIFVLLIGGGAVLYYKNEKQKCLTLELISNQKDEIYNQKQVALVRLKEIQSIRSNLKGQEEAFLKIGNELHDGVAAAIAAVKLQISNIRQQDDNEIKIIKNNLNKIYETVRNISHNLVSTQLKEQAFSKLFYELCDALKKPGIYQIDANLFPEETINALPFEIKLNVYRILQELVVNFLKHAKASMLHINLNLHSNHLNIIYEDNGVGFETETAKQKGIGMQNINQRIEVLNGHWIIDSKTKAGTNIIINIPCSG